MTITSLDNILQLWWSFNHFILCFSFCAFCWWFWLLHTIQWQLISFYNVLDCSYYTFIFIFIFVLLLSSSNTNKHFLFYKVLHNPSRAPSFTSLLEVHVVELHVFNLFGIVIWRWIGMLIFYYLLSKRTFLDTSFSKN